MRIKKIVFIILVLNSTISNAQIIDSFKYYIKTFKPEIIGGLASRNTIVSAMPTSINGAVIGLDYGQKVKFTVGLFALLNPVNQVTIRNQFQANQDTINKTSHLWYLGLSTKYVFYKKNRWTLGWPVRVGFGQSKTNIYKQKTWLESQKNFIMPLETGIDCQYKIVWWMGIGGGLGTRLVLGKNAFSTFSAAYYSLGVNIYFGDIYQRLKQDFKNAKNQ